MIKRIKNNTATLKTWCGQEIDAGSYYEIQSFEESLWVNDSTLLTAIGNEDAIVNNGTSDITDVNSAINYLKGNVAFEVTPTAPKNEFMLNVAGMGKAEFTPSAHVAEITLSNKSGNTYTYSCSLTPHEEDAVCTSNFTSRVYIESVYEDTITLKEELEEGTYTLSCHVHIDYVLPAPPDEFNYWFLWGCFFDASDYGADDWIMLEVIIPDAGVELRRYDECWVRHLVRLGSLDTPDGAPGQIPHQVDVGGGLILPVALRIDWYPTINSSTATKVWYDYKLSTRDGY